MQPARPRRAGCSGGCLRNPLWFAVSRANGFPEFRWMDPTMAQSPLFALEMSPVGAVILALAAGMIAGGVILLLGQLLQHSLFRGPARSWGELGELVCEPAGGLDSFDGAVFEPLPESSSHVPDPFVHGAKMERREA